MNTEITAERTPSAYDWHKYKPEHIGLGWDDIDTSYTYTDYPDRSVVITKEMVDLFADLTGDQNPIHVDPDFARRSLHRQNITHGALLLSIIIGQYHGMGYTYGTTLALLSTKAKFMRACPLGSRVYVDFFVVEKEENAHPKRGRVTFRATMYDYNTQDAYIEADLEVMKRRLKGKSAMKRLGIEK